MRFTIYLISLTSKRMNVMMNQVSGQLTYSLSPYKKFGKMVF